MTNNENLDRELSDIFRLFFDGEPASFEAVNTSRGGEDFREAVTVICGSGGKYMIKLADNDFTFPEKIDMWRRTAEEYRGLGYYCPRILPGKNGNYPSISYKGRRCVAYAEEFSPYRAADTFEGSNAAEHMREAWIMTAKIASKRLSYTDYPSGYCLFDTFCPSDKTDEVLENALEWDKYSRTLPDELRPRFQRIWQLWTENREALEKIYRGLPTSVFQADLNPTNIMLDENGKFVGVIDFNLCGKDVFLNYLFREVRADDYEKELNALFGALKTVCGHYRFSEPEKRAALPLYRCLKPLWSEKLDGLKALGNDIPAVKAFLDETEKSLTADIDFAVYMN